MGVMCGQMFLYTGGYHFADKKKSCLSTFVVLCTVGFTVTYKKINCNLIKISQPLKELCHGVFSHFSDLTKLFSH